MRLAHFLQSTWGLFYKSKFKIACSLNDIQIPTKAIYDLTLKKPSIYASYFVLSLVKFCDPIESVSCSQDQNSRTRHKINSYSYTGNMLKYVFHHQNKYSML